MSNKCQHCGLVNFTSAESCRRCGQSVSARPENFPRILFRRFLGLVAACSIALAGFYISLLFSANTLALTEKQEVDEAISLLEAKGFADEAFVLRHLAAFRSSDNWLNASVEKENAYAATNFPFEIVTIYPEFSTLTADATERAAVLLHEAKHLQGLDERDAYAFVWKNRSRLGWTDAEYGRSEVWQGVRRQTREYLPQMFICEFNDFGDCTR